VTAFSIWRGIFLLLADCGNYCGKKDLPVAG